MTEADRIAMEAGELLKGIVGKDKINVTIQGCPVLPQLEMEKAFVR